MNSLKLMSEVSMKQILHCGDVLPLPVAGKYKEINQNNVMLLYVTSPPRWKPPCRGEGAYY